MFMWFTVFWTLNWTCLWMDWMFTGFFVVVVVAMHFVDVVIQLFLQNNSPFSGESSGIFFSSVFPTWNGWYTNRGSWFAFDYIILTSWWNGIIVPQFMFSCCHSLRQQSLLSKAKKKQLVSFNSNGTFGADCRHRVRIFFFVNAIFFI